MAASRMTQAITLRTWWCPWGWETREGVLKTWNLVWGPELIIHRTRIIKLDFEYSRYMVDHKFPLKLVECPWPWRTLFTAVSRRVNPSLPLNHSEKTITKPRWKQSQAHHCFSPFPHIYSDFPPLPQVPFIFFNRTPNKTIPARAPVTARSKNKNTQHIIDS